MMCAFHAEGVAAMSEQTNKPRLWGYFYAFIVTGMLVLMTGAILPYLMKDFDLSYGQGGLLLSLQAVGNLSAGFLSGFAAMYLGRKAVMVTGAVCFAVGFGCIPLLSSPLLLFLFLFISGMGWGIMNTMVNAAVNDATNGKSSIINLLHMFFSIGGFIAPFIVALSLKLNLNWHYNVILMSVLSAILTVVFLIMPVGSSAGKTENGKSSFAFLKDTRFYIFMGILFFYVGAESTINGWMVTFLLKTGIMSEAGAQTTLSLVWIAIILGRLFSAYISRFFPKEKILLGFSLAGTVCFILFLNTKNPVLLTVSAIGTGLSIAGIYPTTVANAGYLIKSSDIAGAILLSCGGLGASVIPYVAGAVAQRYGIFSVMLTTIVALAALVVFVFLNIAARRSWGLFRG
jgi:MFS transporter, FHS family, glucose/mannose:H+ symporter